MNPAFLATATLTLKLLIIRKRFWIKNAMNTFVPWKSSRVMRKYLWRSSLCKMLRNLWHHPVCYLAWYLSCRYVVFFGGFIHRSSKLFIMQHPHHPKYYDEISTTCSLTFSENLLRNKYLSFVINSYYFFLFLWKKKN